MPRVYVAPINGDDRPTARLVEDRVLVAARALQDRFDVVGARDVQGILETEAAKAAVGCDSSSCVDEIADAMNAEQLVTGQLGRIGDTWQLTLTRTERKTLRVLGRATRASHGESPEGLLDDIPAQVRELFGVATPPVDLWSLASTGVVVVGGAGVAVGVGLYVDSWVEYSAALRDLQPGGLHVDSAQRHKDAGVAVLPYAYVLAGVGLAIAGTGAAVLLFSPETPP